MANKVTPEEVLQAKCFTWFWNTYPTLRRSLFAVPNGGARNKGEASRMKATGTVSGVSDLVWLIPGKVIFIEMKTEKGQQSETQIKFQQMVESLGHEYHVVRSFNEFQTLIVWGIKTFT
jgi:hypothetical protein